MTLTQIIGGIALLVIGGGALIALLLTSLHAGIRRNPSRHRGDEYTDLNSIRGGDGFHHGEGSK